MKKSLSAICVALMLSQSLVASESNVAELTDVKDALAALLKEYRAIKTEQEAFKKSVAEDDAESAKKFDGFVESDAKRKQAQADKLEKDKQALEARIDRLEAMETDCASTATLCQGDKYVNDIISRYVAKHSK